LGALAWLGSAELARQEERAEKALEDHAFAFLAEAARQIEEHITRRGESLLSTPLDLKDRRMVAVAAQRIEEEQRVLDVVVLDGEGGMVFPQVSPPLETGLPFHATSSSREIQQAEILEALGDEHGARMALAGVIQSENRGNARDNPLLRAHFMLAGLFRKNGELSAAAEHYRSAAAEAYLDWRRGPSGRAPAAVGLLCETALAEIDLSLGRGHVRALELMRDIAEGVHNDVTDRMLEQVLVHLRDQIADDADLHDQIEAVLRFDRVRLAGRRFAAEYQSLLRETMGRRLRQAGEETIYQIYNAPGIASVLALRPLADVERAESLDWLGQAAFFGLRLNLELLLTEAAGNYLLPDSAGFYLEVADQDGDLVLSSSGLRQRGASVSGERAVRHAFAGLQLRAVPTDATGYLEARRRSFRNRALLILSLCLTAGGGAFFLLRSAARDAEVAQLKVALVSRVSHDLKTPLALIKMYSETLNMGRTADAAQVEKFSGIISREADSLSRQIERILDFSRQEAGTLQYRPSRTDLGTTLESLVAAYRPHVEARGVALTVSLEPDLIASVDRAAFESAAINLLENAVKYTADDAPEREVRVELHRRNGEATVDVIDRGIGIPDAERTKVFTGFYRASNAGETRGAGLGLSLVRHFAEAHGGTIEALPRQGGGSKLRLTLPLENDTEDAGQHPCD
jgi:signal transduction histidine kinase